VSDLELHDLKRQIAGHIAMLQRNADLANHERMKNVKLLLKKPEAAAEGANAYGRMVGINQGITSLQIILETIEKHLRPLCKECGHVIGE
jgi:hypothetical protein